MLKGSGPEKKKSNKILRKDLKNSKENIKLIRERYTYIFCLISYNNNEERGYRFFSAMIDVQV